MQVKPRPLWVRSELLERPQGLANFGYDASMARRRPAAIATAALLVLLAALIVSPPLHVATTPLPETLSDHAFWQMIVDFSEPNGFFRSDNLVSNETAFQRVIPELLKRTPRGSVYIGVGPDQNFTYIVALEPRLAFIVDIRRQNMLLHLMYKALVELSEDRGDFLSRLFSRPRPSGLAATATAQRLFDAYGDVAPDQRLARANLDAILDHLVMHHGFALTEADLTSIDFVYRSFVNGGPKLQYSFQRGNGPMMPAFPTFEQLMMETDGHGEHRSYLASEENYTRLRALQLANLIVPLVGDFGGPRALRSVAGYLREHGATVAAFYTSNVEQYLFQTGSWRRFFGNVAILPLDGTSLFIRAYFVGGGFRSTMAGGLRSAALLDAMTDAVAAFHNGQIASYRDVIERSWQPYPAP